MHNGTALRHGTQGLQESNNLKEQYGRCGQPILHTTNLQQLNEIQSSKIDARWLTDAPDLERIDVDCLCCFKCICWLGSK